MDGQMPVVCSVTALRIFRTESLVAGLASSPGSACRINAQVARYICHRDMEIVDSEGSLNSLRQAFAVVDDH